MTVIFFSTCIKPQFYYTVFNLPLFVNYWTLWTRSKWIAQPLISTLFLKESHPICFWYVRTTQCMDFDGWLFSFYLENFSWVNYVVLKMKKENASVESKNDCFLLTGLEIPSDPSWLQVLWEGEFFIKSWYLLELRYCCFFYLCQWGRIVAGCPHRVPRLFSVTELLTLKIKVLKDSGVLYS